MEDTPKVSVIIPVYNVEKYLKECLNSVVGQTLKDIEIICVDDGSKDSSLNILREYQKRDPRINVLTQENQGAGVARNSGLAIAKGKYIAFMDADDIYPDFSTLRAMAEAAESNNVQICGGGISSININRKIICGKDRGVNCFFPTEGVISYRDFQYEYGFTRYLFSKNLLDSNNIKFPNYLCFEDPPFLVKAMLAAGRFYAMSQDTYCHRLGYKNITWTNCRINDLVTGVTDVFDKACQNDLEMLARRCVERINKQYKGILRTSLKNGNRDLFFKLIKFNINVYNSKYSESLLILLNETLNDFRRMDKLEQENYSLKEGIYQSASYKIGRFITWLPRKIRGGIRCYQEHGLQYTLQRVRVHLLKFK